MGNQHKGNVYMNLFASGENTQLNACVGRNGWPGTNYYANGFDSVVHTVCRDTISRGFGPDEVVYPIVFCARHRVELFLKMQIRLIERVRGHITVSDPKLMRTHDLGALWEMYVTASGQCDPRYKEMVSLIEPAIRELSLIDPTGETFRYAYDNNNNKHLEGSVSLINIEVFYSAFCALSEGIKNAEILTDFLSDEYGTGTYTKQASRSVIENISKELTRKSNWGKPCFRVVKNEICERYSISQRGLSEIIDVIKSHREFAFNIGVEISIEDISAEKIANFLEFRIRATAESNKSNWRDVLLSGSGMDREFYSFLCKNYSIREMSALLALADVSSPLCYSEAYDDLCDQYECGESDTAEFSGYLNGKSFIAPKIILGLKKLRQISTLKYISSVGVDVGDLPFF